MKKQFDTKAFLTANRDFVIAKYDQLTSEEFFDGITLKEFMMEVMNICLINYFRNEKVAKAKLPFLVGDIYFEHSRVICENNLSDKRAAKAPSSEWLAIL